MTLWWLWWNGSGTILETDVGLKGRECAFTATLYCTAQEQFYNLLDVAENARMLTGAGSYVAGYLNLYQSAEMIIISEQARHVYNRCVQ